MQTAKYITIISNRRKIILDVNTILYVTMVGKTIEVHVAGGDVYETRSTLGSLEEALGEQFIKAHRGCMVSARAIHSITDRIQLSNGESLPYTIRKKKELIDTLHRIQKSFFADINEKNIPHTQEAYKRHYCSFDTMPFAFADIEMVFDEQKHAIDWIFRYGNEALAKLEKLPLDRLIDSSFGALFSNMDSKWLRSYERATLYGEMLEIVDYSPEIDTRIKIICFPTFPGHCGCILFDIGKLRSAHNGDDAMKELIHSLQM